MASNNAAKKNTDHLPLSERDYFTDEEKVEIVRKRALSDTGKYRSISLAPELISKIIFAMEDSRLKVARLEKERDLYIETLTQGKNYNGFWAKKIKAALEIGRKIRESR